MAKSRKQAEQAKIAAGVSELETILTKVPEDQQVRALAEFLFGKDVKLV